MEVEKTLKTTLEDETPTILFTPNGKLVTQLPGGITFTYDLRLGHLRDR